MMKKRMLAMALVLLVALPLLLAGCESAPDVPEETSHNYLFLPYEGDLSIEEMVVASIEKIQEVTGREDEPGGFQISKIEVMGGMHNTSGHWNIMVLYPGGDCYVVKVNSLYHEIVNIVLLPENYYDEMNTWFLEHCQVTRDAETIYSKEG